MDWRAVLILVIEALLALFLLYREGLLGNPARGAIAVYFIALAFVIRGLCLDYKTLDYIDFLSRWVDYFRQNGGFATLKDSVGNYNIPYLYFLALFSYSDINDLYLIKELSILFDILLAWSVMRLTGLFRRGEGARLAAFLTALLLPTVLLNGSLWGQCDSSYTALALLGLYLALSGRPAFSMVCMTLSFGFKLQAVFVLPIIAVLWLMGKFNWKHILLFPLSYVLLVLPAVLLGRPLLDTLTLYFNQTGSIGSGLNYNSSSIFGLFWNVYDEPYAAKLAVIAAFAYMFLVFFVALLYKRRLTSLSAIVLAVLFSVGIPFLLPHMHDRYFFVADMLTLVLAFSAPRLALTAPLAQFASLLGYHAYLKMRYLLPMSYGSWALIAVLLISAVGFVFTLKKPSFPSDEPRGEGDSRLDPIAPQP